VIDLPGRVERAEGVRIFIGSEKQGVLAVVFGDDHRAL
jgi:hypothetical protein